jgi:hypothetical protein
MSLRRKLTTEDQAAIEQQQQREETARQLRTGVARFKETFSLSALQDQLPLRFPTPPVQPEQPRFRALSWYAYPGWTALCDPRQLASMSAFYIPLHLIDFSPLRAELVHLTGIALNAPGQTPFDPLSLFLCCLLRLEKGLGWKELAKFLAGPEAACWRALFGFQQRTPGASTMRRFFNALGTAFNTDLCPRFITLLHSAGLLPQPTPPPERGLPLTCDGMLHAAHSSMRCGKVTDTCYQPTSPQAPRPCPAREAGHEGCDCSSQACQHACRLVTPRDPQARLIHYSGTNQEGEQDPDRARDVYGYRSYAQLLRDDELHLAWVGFTSVHAANTDERVIFPVDFQHFRQRLPYLPIAEVVADSALGYTDCLETVYTAGAIPVIVIRRAPSDKDPRICQWRGYDKDGHPLCAHGYPMRFNGLDYQRLRACWVCRQLCTRLPNAKPEDAQCPFRDPERPLGYIQHVSSAFIHPDGTQHARLARLYPYGSELWKAHYAPRKNAVEGRNSQLTRLGLKRLWSYGLTGATADLTFADLLINLRTLGRLVQEASALVT